MSNDLVMGNDFDAFPESWGLNTIGATIQEQLFTNPDQWDENTIRTGVEDALTKRKDSIKEYSVLNGMCQVFYENLTCSASHLPKANFVWLVFNVGKEKL